MNRAVYIGGFLGSRASAERVANALSPDFRGVDIFTSSDAVRQPDQLREAVDHKDVDVITHSDGFRRLLACTGVRPDFVHIFNAPLPTGRLRTLGRTCLKTVHMHMPGRNIHYGSIKDDIKAVALYDIGTTAELIAHPVANLRPYINGTIARFDAVTAALAMKQAGTGVHMITTNRDDYYRYGAEEARRAGTLDIPIFRIEGEHDALVLRPHHAWNDYIYNREIIPSTQD